MIDHEFMARSKLLEKKRIFYTRRLMASLVSHKRTKCPYKERLPSESRITYCICFLISTIFFLVHFIQFSVIIVCCIKMFPLVSMRICRYSFFFPANQTIVVNKNVNKLEITLI